MSPYRVMAVRGGVKHIMLAALRVDKTTGVRKVFIEEKFNPKDSGMHQISDKELAHRQSGKRNAHIHAFYQIVDKPDSRRYYVLDMNINSDTYQRRVGEEIFTMAEGLQVALHDYCRTQDLEIVQEL